MTILHLPWPPAVLSPNSRKDRRHSTAARREYRVQCWAVAKAGNAAIRPDAHLTITFHPPDRRRRDLDNLLGAVKYGLDGLALAAGVDDYGWSLSISRAEPVAGGAVVVHVSAPAEIREAIS